MNQLRRILTSLYELLIRAGSNLQSFILLIFRLAFGWELVESGWRHLHDVQAMAARFESWGIPHPHANVYISGTTEMVGGALLMLGLASRLICVPLIVNFIVAYLTASRGTVQGFFHNDPANFIDDAAFPFLITAILVLAFGPGKISVDAWLKRRLGRGTAAPKKA
jgi:putative oxidoreductase